MTATSQITTLLGLRHPPMKNLIEYQSMMRYARQLAGKKVNKEVTNAATT